MQTTIEGGSAFAYINVDLDPGETIIAEADAMSSMDADLDWTPNSTAASSAVWPRPF